MAKKKTLVIVESPAKAKKIGSFLGSDYVVEASLGHIRDLPQRAADIPADVKKEKWAKEGVNVEKDRKSTRLNSSHIPLSRMPSSA